MGRWPKLLVQCIYSLSLKKSKFKTKHIVGIYEYEILVVLTQQLKLLLPAILIWSSPIIKSLELVTQLILNMTNEAP